MPHKKPHHTKNTGYWFKKWLNSALIDLNLKKRRFQKPASDIVFLTSEEVKAALAKVSTPETATHAPDLSPRPDPGILPQKNRLSAHHRKPLNFRKKLLRIFKQISYRILKKKHSANAHHHHSRHRSADDASITDDKFQKLSELQLSHGNQGLTEQIPDPGHRQHHHRKHRHRNLFRRTISLLKRNIKFLHKQKELNQPFTFETNEVITTPVPKKIPWIDYIKPTLTSTAMFIVAYQLSWFFYQLAVMIMASFFNINSVLFYYEVMFPEGIDASKWTPETIIIITLAGPFSALIGWTILRFVLGFKNHYGSHFRMFLVWLYLISMMMFFGAFIGGAITLEGFGYVIDWLFMSISLRLILSLIFIIMIIAISWKVVSLMPETSRNHSWKNNRYKYILSRLIIPWILGASIMTVLKITKNITQHVNIFDYDLINLATLVFAVVPPLFNSKSRPQLIRRKANQRLKAELPLLWLAGAILLVLLFRFVLSYGIYFSLIFKLDVNFYN